jgi:hypothetical protein
MIIRTLDDVTADALAAMSSTEDPRLRDILASLVKNLHAFVRDVRLTEPELRQAALKPGGETGWTRDRDWSHQRSRRNCSPSCRSYPRCVTPDP